MLRLVLAASTALSVAACMSTPGEKVPAAHYRCRNGADLQVQFPEGRALVTFPDATTITLSQQISGQDSGMETGGTSCAAKAQMQPGAHLAKGRSPARRTRYEIYASADA